MNGFDIVLLASMGILVVVGLMKGLVRILVGFGALIAAFLVASMFHEPLADRLGLFDLPVGVLRLICYLLIFIAVMLAGSLLAFLIRKLVKAAMLSWADRLAGAAVGVAVAFLAFSVLVLPIVAYAPGGSSMLSHSTLAPYVLVVSDMAARFVPDDLVRKFRKEIGELKDSWKQEEEPVSKGRTSV